MNTNGESQHKTDEEILHLFFARNESAILVTDRKFGRKLRKIAEKYLADTRDIEECLDDAYLDVWNAIPPESPRSLGAYLTTIVRRRAIDRYKAYTRRKQIPLAATQSLEELEEILPDPRNTESMAEARELGRVIERFLETLTVRTRYVFMSRYYASRSIEEISMRLNVSKTTVERELTSIRRSLRAVLEREGYTT